MATFGYTSDGGADLLGANNYMVVTKFTLTESATLNYIYVLYNGNATEHVKGLIYSDSSGPNTLLASSSATLVGSGVQWVQCTLSGSLSAGDYWLGAVTDDNTGAYRCNSSATGFFIKDSTASGNYSSPPSTFPSPGSITDQKLSVYVDYTHPTATIVQKKSLKRLGARIGTRQV